jgi:hypothetical protein
MLGLSFALPGSAQEHGGGEASEGAEAHAGPHVFGGVIGFTAVETPDETTQVAGAVRFIPVIAAEYVYKINQRWGLNAIGEWELAHYVVETHGGGDSDSGNPEDALAREGALMFLGLLEFYPSHRWALEAGAGYEFEKHENLFVLRGGIAYEIPMRDGMAVGFPLTFDWKEEFWAVSIGMGLTWGPGH